MPRIEATRRSKTTKNSGSRCQAVVVSIGCPSGIGPEVAVAAAEKFVAAPAVLVGDLAVIRAAAKLKGVDLDRLSPYLAGGRLSRSKIYTVDVGPKLSARERQPGKPSKRAGAAQLRYIESAYELVRTLPGAALVTGPVSKHAIASSGTQAARKFRGHTEWLQMRDGANSSVMCFAAPQLVSALVTTHLPLKKVPNMLTPEAVAAAIIGLTELLRKLSPRPVRVAVCALNPHAGEGELLGREERQAILPGMRRAQRSIGGALELVGPIGAETAFRKALSGQFAGVVAMYHDQATIPMKLVAFGEAVNVTMGLSIVRTSVDHGTAYDIAWQGRADMQGMLSAMQLGARLVG